MDLSRIRNFSIIAHIDHGKSTLSDRILEITGAVDARTMRAQYLDTMDLERERGITIKAQNVRVGWDDHTLHLIDTPGHVDFGYEVSRSLAACEGVVLLVDAAQGIEAQTLANCYLALENELEIVAVLNKIDLPAADPDLYASEIENVLGLPAEQVLKISAKTGEGIPALLDAIVERIPPPKGDPEAPLQALIFDSHFDQYRGVISSMRVMNGRIRKNDKLRFMQLGGNHDALELGVRSPAPIPVDELGPGEVGYLIASIKDVGQAKSGETVTLVSNPAAIALDGYDDPKPMVFCGLYPVDGDEYPELREALHKLKLNDASVTFEPETSGALGFGFRCGFLGLLHMEIVRERLEREFDLSLIATAPSVAYKVSTDDGAVIQIDNPSELPEPGSITHIEEPMLKVGILSPSSYTGTIMELCQGRRGTMTRMEYLSPERVELQYVIPLAEVVTDFFDQLKSRTQGYASLDYEPEGYQIGKLVKVDILLNGEPVDAFSTIVHNDNAYDYGRRMAEKLQELIPRQMFDVPIQAAIGGRIIARQTVKAKRKDVLAKCYGGDITRKRKLLEQQKKGKKRMKAIGRVEVPNEAFVSALRLDD
ncbi:MAG TPA: elongation factor 4 [Acidimicrobiaceae bacterium]|jgi:GTP-binding protein LepA|nr:elongation factor 4 [Actinomycetota bacterium]MDG1198231.1 translation elongation factor 4 [Actinomycetota bacterium]MDG1489778.1 translation elongation factor 4 [Actinomycetota bacterium]MDG2120841.1 translation elongation factor 4 [Actinomycetota bacterium]HAN07114.1 elongation factor 4 [Acidimicrobiaceae bacterium]